MSTDRDTRRIVRSWLRTDDHESADRVLDAVVDRLEATPQRRAMWWPTRRNLVMSTPFRWGAAAIVAVAIAVIGFSYYAGGRGTGASTSTPSASESPSVKPTPSPSPMPVVSGSLPAAGDIIQGTYVVGDPFPVDMGIELGPGWTVWGGQDSDVVPIFEDSPDPPAGHGIIFVIVNNVYADPCNPLQGSMDPPVGPSPADLAAALIAQPGTESTDPVPVSIDGYDGVFLDYRNTGDGECSTLQRWPTVGSGNREALVGERDQVWIIDVEGTRLVIDAFSFRETTESDLAEIREIVEAMDLGPASP